MDSQADQAMNVTLPLEIAWNVAAREAIAGGFEEIRPEHVCIGVLKVSEIPAQELLKVVSESETSAGVARELQDLRKAIRGREIDSTYFRRGLRMLLGQGDCEHEGGVIHRSTASRVLFDAAASFAGKSGSASVRTHDLLEVLFAAPSPDIARLLRNHPKPEPSPNSALLPLLTRYAVDVSKRGPGETGGGSRAPKAVCRAIENAVQARVPGTIFLVTDEDEFARDVVGEIAARVAREFDQGGETPSIIFDVTDAVEKGGEAELTVGDLFDEATRVPSVILFLSFLTQEAGGNAGGIRSEDVRQASLSGQPTLICRIGPREYEEHVARDRTWVKSSRVIWLKSLGDAGIPDEL